MVSKMKYSQYLFQYLTTVYLDCISIVTMFYSLYVNLLVLFNRYLLTTQSLLQLMAIFYVSIVIFEYVKQDFYWSQWNMKYIIWVCWPVFCQRDMGYSHQRGRNLDWENASIGSGYTLACMAFFKLMIDARGPSSLWVIPSLGGWPWVL